MQKIKFGCTTTPCNLWGVTEKIARSGLCYQHLQSAYEQNGKDEIQAHFSEKFNGRLHITKSKINISSIAQHFIGQEYWRA